MGRYQKAGAIGIDDRGKSPSGGNNSPAAEDSEPFQSCYICHTSHDYDAPIEAVERAVVLANKHIAEVANARCDIDWCREQITCSICEKWCHLACDPEGIAGASDPAKHASRFTMQFIHDHDFLCQACRLRSSTGASCYGRDPDFSRLACLNSINYTRVRLALLLLLTNMLFPWWKDICCCNNMSVHGVRPA